MHAGDSAVAGGRGWDGQVSLDFIRSIEEARGSLQGIDMHGPRYEEVYIE